jgi:hypothetical protein
MPAPIVRNFIHYSKGIFIRKGPRKWRDTSEGFEDFAIPAMLW